MAIKSPTTLTNLLVAPTVSTVIPTVTMVDGNPVAASMEINSTEGAFLPPRMTTAQMNALTPVTPGMIVFNTNAFPDGLYIYKDGRWQPIGGGVSTKTVTFTNAEFLTLRAPGGVQSLPLLDNAPANSAYLINSAVVNVSLAGGGAYMVSSGAGGAAYICYSSPAIGALATNAVGGGSVSAGTIQTAGIMAALFSSNTTYTALQAQGAAVNFTLTPGGGATNTFYTGGNANATVTVAIEYVLLPFIG